MAVGREQPGAERYEAEFSEIDVEAALDLLEVFEIASHDCYRDVTPPESIVDDVLVLSDGTIAGLVRSVHLALADWRDVKLNAMKITGQASLRQSRQGVEAVDGVS